MKKHDDIGRLQDILDAIRKIQAYIRGIDEREFAKDSMRQDAVVRQIEIIGEAGRNVSPEFQEQHPEIPWSQMIGMRNKLIHDYSEADIPTVWDAAKNDVPQLKKAISKLLTQL